MSRRLCVTRVSTCRLPSSRCACRSPRNLQLTVGGATIAAKPLEFTIGTPPEGVSGPLVAAPSRRLAGLYRRPDYDGLPVSGCRGAGGPRRLPVLGEAGRGRAERGAVAIDRRQQRGRRRDGRHARREAPTPKIPVVSVTRADRASGCAAQPGETTIKLNAGVRVERTRNVIAADQDGVHRRRA